MPRSRLSLLAAAAVASVSFAQNPRTPETSELQIPRVSRAPRLEDFLGPPPAESGVRVADFRQREPGDGAAATQPTEAYLSYDGRNLYVVFVCKDDPAKVRAHLAKREDISADDQVSVYLDTFRDRQRAYVFSANPLGIQSDAILTEGKEDDASFDTVWHSQGRLTPDGYVVRIAIPFKSLRFSSAARQSWGLALGRTILRNNEHVFWPYVTNRVEGFVQQMAPVAGLDEIAPGRNLQLIPYGIFTGARYLDFDAPAFRRQADVRGGLDAKVVLRRALTLDLALNPDFSQVESDEPQVTVNERFEVFFPEKRPFFIENAGFFETPVNLFFSRRIADPQGGVRLTGKLGRWAVGALAADDRAAGRQVDPDERGYGRRAYVGVARLQREFGSQSSVGLLATSRDFASGANRVISADLRLKLSPNWVATGQATRSFSRTPARSRLSGPAYHAELLHSGRHFTYSGSYDDISPDFRTELGFIPRVDIRQAGHYASYRWRPEGRRLVSFGPAFNALANWDRQGRLQDWYGSAEFKISWTGQTDLKFSRSESYEWYLLQGYRQHRNGASFYSGWLKWLWLYASYSFGKAINYSPPGGYRPLLADTTDAALGFGLRPTAHFRLEQTYIHRRLDARAGTPLAAPGGSAIFNNHLARWKLNYQFTPALSLRTIVDYYGLLPNTSLTRLERSKLLTFDVLLTRMLNPGTALYVGYTDNRQNLALDPGAPPHLRLTASPGMSTGRQFFIKISHLFRF